MKQISDIERTRKLLEKYGGEVDDFFKLWPLGKEFFFSSDGRAVLAYQVRYKVAVCAFGAVGPDESVSKLMREFKSYCHSHGWQFAFVRASGNHDEAFRRAGMKRIVIGGDCDVNVVNFESRALRTKLRNKINRLSKQGYKIERHDPPHSKQLLTELRAISDDWLKIPRHYEWRFLEGVFDDDYLALCPLLVLRDGAGHAEAFVNEITSYKKRAAGIDMMRFRRGAEHNSMDFLLVELIRQLKRDGYRYLNLGMSPLAGKPFAVSRVDHLVVWFCDTFQSVMRFKGLHQFKAKFYPEWQPRYMYVSGQIWQLPRIGLAIMRVAGKYKPGISQTDRPVEATESMAEQQI